MVFKGKKKDPDIMASITINFFSKGAEVIIENAENIAVGRIERTLPDIYRQHHMELASVRRKLNREQKEKVDV